MSSIHNIAFSPISFYGLRVSTFFSKFLFLGELSYQVEKVIYLTAHTYFFFYNVERQRRRKMQLNLILSVINCANSKINLTKYCDSALQTAMKYIKC